MKIIKPPDPEPALKIPYEHSCGAILELHEEDIEADYTKKVGTYWFDGSADRAGLGVAFYTKSSSKCPCGDYGMKVKSKLVTQPARGRLVAALEAEKGRR